MTEATEVTLYDSVIELYDILDDMVKILIHADEPPKSRPLYSSTRSSEYNDPVDHPSHYQSKEGLETIDVIKAFTTDMKGMEAVCSSNVIKYICRWKHKNGLEDLKKAKWYLNELINHVEKESKQYE